MSIAALLHLLFDMFSVLLVGHKKVFKVALIQIKATFYLKVRQEVFPLKFGDLRAEKDEIFEHGEKCKH